MAALSDAGNSRMAAGPEDIALRNPPRYQK
jgi:hypothetical protein